MITSVFVVSRISHAYQNYKATRHAVRAVLNGNTNLLCRSADDNSVAIAVMHLLMLGITWRKWIVSWRYCVFIPDPPISSFYYQFTASLVRQHFPCCGGGFCLRVMQAGSLVRIETLIYPNTVWTLINYTVSTFAHRIYSLYRCRGGNWAGRVSPPRVARLMYLLPLYAEAKNLAPFREDQLASPPVLEAPAKDQLTFVPGEQPQLPGHVDTPPALLTPDQLDLRLTLLPKNPEQLTGPHMGEPVVPVGDSGNPGNVSALPGFLLHRRSYISISPSSNPWKIGLILYTALLTTMDTYPQVHQITVVPFPGKPFTCKHSWRWHRHAL